MRGKRCRACEKSRSRRALMCVKISAAALGEGATARRTEALARAFMDLSDSQLNKILKAWVR